MKPAFYFVFIICTTLIVGIFVNFMEKRIQARTVHEKIVYTLPKEAKDIHNKVYRFDDETIIVVITTKKKGKK